MLQVEPPRPRAPEGARRAPRVRRRKNICSLVFVVIAAAILLGAIAWREGRATEEQKTGEREDKYEYNEDDEAWWRLYRQEMPWEEYSSLSRGQKSSRRRRFQKAVAATREEKARVSSVREA